MLWPRLRDRDEAERDTVHIRKGFHSIFLEHISERVSPGRNPVESPSWTPLEQAIVRNLPGVHLKTQVCWCRTKTLGPSRRDRWHAGGYLREYRHAFGNIIGFGAVRHNEQIARLV